MEKFNLNFQFKVYLSLVGLEENKMSEIQLQEIKRAFMGACGQMLLMFRDDITKLTDEQAIQTMQELLDEASKYWENETNYKNN